MDLPADDSGASLERFRQYLSLLARMRLPQQDRRKFDTSDIVQQTLMDVHRKLPEFEGSSEDMAAWLRKILANNLADAFRALNRDKRDIRRERSIYDGLSESALDLEEWLAAIQTSPDARAEKNEQLVRLAGALAQLSEAQREAVEMHHLKGMTIDETAEQLGRTALAVGGLLRHGLARLRKLLQEDTR